MRATSLARTRQFGHFTTRTLLSMFCPTSIRRVVYHHVKELLQVGECAYRAHNPIFYTDPDLSWVRNCRRISYRIAA